MYEIDRNYYLETLGQGVADFRTKAIPRQVESRQGLVYLHDNEGKRRKSISTL
jgi:hypothetical protein